MSLLETGIKAATSIGTGLLAGHQAKKQREFEQAEAQKQRDWSEHMANYQNEWNLEQWNRQNEYNSPSAQIARMKEAGLNPLYYGLDGSSASEVSAAQPLGYERASMAGIANPITAGVDAALKTAQVFNVQADTAKKGEETLSEVVSREKMQQEIENARQQLENMKSEKGLTEARTAEINKALEWVDRLNAANLAATEARTALDKATQNRIDKMLEGELKIQAKTIEDFDHKWKKIKAECGKIAQETKLLQKDIENYALNHASNGFMGTGLSIQNLLRLLADNPRNTDPLGNYDGTGLSDNTD